MTKPTNIKAIEKEPSKSSVGIGQEKVPTQERADAWKNFWKQQLVRFDS